jgi:hypothetical protein
MQAWPLAEEVQLMQKSSEPQAPLAVPGRHAPLGPEQQPPLQNSVVLLLHPVTHSPVAPLHA